MAPAQAAAQILAQLEVGGRQLSGRKHPAGNACGRAGRIHEPVESPRLLHGCVQVHVIHQHGRPAFVELRRIAYGRIHPADNGPLIAQRFTHRLEQVGLARARFAPQIGRHGRTRHLAAAFADPQPQVLQHRDVRTREETRQRGTRCQTDIQRHLLHGRHTDHALPPEYRRSRARQAGKRSFGNITKDRAKGPRHRFPRQGSKGATMVAPR